MSKTQIRIVAAVAVLAAILGGLLVYRGYVERRESLLFGVEFAVGTPRVQVVAKLGNPDQELVGAELKKYSAFSRRECLGAATKLLRYFLHSQGGGAYCEVYFNAEDRVVCVERGFIAI